MTWSSPISDGGLCGVYDVAVPLGAVDMASQAMNAYGIRCCASVSQIGAARDVLAVYVVPPDGEVPSIAELKDVLARMSAGRAGVRFELALAVSRKGMSGRDWSRVAPGIARVEADFHVKPTMSGGGLFGYDPRTLAAIFAGLRTRNGPSGAGGAGEDARLSGKPDSGGWHRKGNCRLWGDVRLVRFKVRRGASGDAPLHRSETPLGTLRLGRTVWVVVRQCGPLAFSQIPRTSETNALVRVRYALSRVVHPAILLPWGLAVRKRKFSHFLLLGYNCETAYRFLMANGFLDATFFAWTSAWTCDTTLDALRHFDSLFTGELAFSGDGDLFVDVPTGLSMHSRHRSDPGASASALYDVEAEKAELRSRTAHLREKFYRQLRDDEPTLAVVKISASDASRGDEFARLLVGQLREMGGRNLRLLVVCQKADAACFPPDHPDYDLRTVSEFSPDWNAATELAGDRLGWMKIWREFAPAHRIVQHKTYKFQEKGRR